MTWRALTLVALLVVVVPAFSEERLKCDVPFGFTVGSQQWPAGSYEISFPSQSIVLIRGVDQKEAMFVMTSGSISKAGAQQGKLVFNRYGDRHFLSQIWSQGTERGHLVRKSKAELETAARHTTVDVAGIPSGNR